MVVDSNNKDKSRTGVLGLLFLTVVAIVGVVVTQGSIAISDNKEQLPDNFFNGFDEEEELLNDYQSPLFALGDDDDIMSTSFAVVDDDDDNVVDDENMAMDQHLDAFFVTLEEKQGIKDGESNEVDQLLRSLQQQPRSGGGFGARGSYLDGQLRGSGLFDPIKEPQGNNEYTDVALPRSYARSGPNQVDYSNPDSGGSGSGTSNIKGFKNGGYSYQDDNGSNNGYYKGKNKGSKGGGNTKGGPKMKKHTKRGKSEY
jgi:hypothetical protein